MAMHPHFSDWYRSVAVVPEETTLQKRWAGIEALAKDCPSEMVLALAHFFTYTRTPDPTRLPGFQDAFKAADEAFPLRDNLQELRVLAGATLRQIMEQLGPRSMLTALALVCGSFGPRASALVEPDHLRAAQKLLATTAVTVRRTSATSLSDVTRMTKARFAQIIPDANFAQNSVANLKDHFTNAFVELGDALWKTHIAVNDLLHTVQVREEELNMLWWLQNRYSTTLSKSFEQVGSLAGALIFPTEVARLTTFIPGPPAFAAVLLRALDEAGIPQTQNPPHLMDIVNATPREWRESICNTEKLGATPWLFPLLYAAQCSLTTDGSTEWGPVYDKACDIPPDYSPTLEDFVIQSYREWMLLRVSNESSK